MVAPEIIALIGIMLSSMVFYKYARKVNDEKLTLDGFMLSDRNISASQFSNTFAASSFSLATNTMFLFVNCQNYAVFMLVAPITYLLGHYMFIALVRKSNVDVNDCRTVSDLCYKFFKSRAIARLITAMTVSSYIMLVFIELFLGSIVLTFFLPETLIFQTISFLGIGIIVLLYVKLGGLKALIMTDKWQLFLMMLATSLITVFALIAPTINHATSAMILKSLLTPTESTKDLIIFMLWLTMMNFLMPFTQVANWQRVTASKNVSISWKGLIFGTKNVVLLFLLTLFGFMLLKAKGYQLTSLAEFLELVKSSGGISSYVIFPLMIVGFCSMVFSSADTAVISVTYAICDQNSFLAKFSRMSENKLRKTLTGLILAILIALTVIYWFQFTALKDWLLPLIYGVCGQIAILTPLPVYILWQHRKKNGFKSMANTGIKSSIIFAGILLSWGLLIYCSYLTKVTGEQSFSQLSVPFGCLLISILILMTKNISSRSFSAIVRNRHFARSPE